MTLELKGSKESVGGFSFPSSQKVNVHLFAFALVPLGKVFDNYVIVIFLKTSWWLAFHPFRENARTMDSELSNSLLMFASSSASHDACI